MYRYAGVSALLESQKAAENDHMIMIMLLDHLDYLD